MAVVFVTAEFVLGRFREKGPRALFHITRNKQTKKTNNQTQINSGTFPKEENTKPVVVAGSFLSGAAEELMLIPSLPLLSLAKSEALTYN